jgi:T-lymphoma invasion and metastasis-inducing protein 2
MSVPELYRDPTMAATFPATVEPACLYREHSLSHKPYRASFASALDVPAEEEEEGEGEGEEEEERLEARQYSSYTLPCRRPKAHTLSEDLGGCQDPEQYQAGPEFGFQKKDSIKNRIRRLSDWTGSLARKKKSQVSQTSVLLLLTWSISLSLSCSLSLTLSLSHALSRTLSHSLQTRLGGSRL